MRAPRRQFNRSIAVVVIGIACLIVTGLFPDDPARLGVQIAVGVVGILGTIFGTLAIIWSRGAAHVERGLREGRNVIGQWRVDRGTWDRFVALNATVSLNHVSTQIDVPTDGIDVIVSPDGLLIGDQVERFNRTTIVNGAAQHWGGDWTVTQASLGGDNPCCLYLYAGMRGNHGAPTFTNLIVPVPAEAIPEATRVRDHFLAAVGSSAVA